jgi:hypothetical protein
MKNSLSVLGLVVLGAVTLVLVSSTRTLLIESDSLSAQALKTSTLSETSTILSPITTSTELLNTTNKTLTTMPTTTTTSPTFFKSVTTSVKGLFTPTPITVEPSISTGILVAFERPHNFKSNTNLQHLKTEDQDIRSLDYKIIISGQRPIDVKLTRGERLPESLEIGSQVSFDKKSINRISETESFIEPQKLTVVGLPSPVSNNSRSGNPIYKKKIAIIMLNTVDEGISYSNSDIKRILLTRGGGLRDFWNKMSSGKFELTGNISSDGDVFGPYTTSITQSNCNGWQAQNDGLPQAVNDGFVYSAYDYVMFLLPEGTNCGWGGIAVVMTPLQQMYPDPVTGAKYAWSFVRTFKNQKDFIYVANHELGHNLGLYHARSFGCFEEKQNINGRFYEYKKFGNPNISRCYTQEYGDPFDVMGFSTSDGLSISTTHQDWLYFLDPLDKQFFTRNGMYKLRESLSVNSQNPSLIRIPIKYTSQNNWFNGFTRYIELELRKVAPLNTRAQNNSNSSSIQQLFIRYVYYERGVYDSSRQRITSWYTPDPHLIFPKDSSNLNNYNYLAEKEAFLVEGESFYEPYSGLKIVFNKSNSPDADIYIEKKSQTCIQGDKILEILPQVYTLGRPFNIKASFAVSVINNDSGPCFPVYSSLLSWDLGYNNGVKEYLEDFPAIFLPANTTKNYSITLTARDRSLITTPPISSFHVSARNVFGEYFISLVDGSLSIENPFYNSRRSP